MSRRGRRSGPPQVPQPQQQSRLTSLQRLQAWSGPVPPPALLDHYEQIQPGFANRIVTMAEEEANHRRDCEKAALNAEIELNRSDFSERKRGQIFAFLVVLFLGGAGIYFVLHGKEIAGSIFGLPAIAAIVGAFLYRKKDTKKSED